MQPVDTAVACGLLLGALLACKAGGAKGDEKPIAVKATDLVDEYHRNEVAADERYKGKLLTVVGQVAAIEKDAFDNIVVRLKTANPFMGAMA